MANPDKDEYMTGLCAARIALAEIHGDGKCKTAQEAFAAMSARLLDMISDRSAEVRLKH